MQKLPHLHLILLLFPFLTQAQSPKDLPTTPAYLTCATTEMMQSHPELWLKQQQLEEMILAKKGMAAAENAEPLPYKLPVVVHVIHENGAENISDAQIFDAIEHLNQAFAHEGYYAQQGDGTNMQIQFCLANRDPDGNVTTGITRTESPLTTLFLEFQDIPMKNLNRWDPKEYVNIWVVKEILSFGSGPGVAGYAFFPSAHGQAEDGLVCEARFFGISPSEDAVLIHEMGHYLGLYHTFQGGCPNADCNAQGDRVCDTPPDGATHTSCAFNSCDTDVAPGSPFTSDEDDFTGDFMDYSPFSCYHFFTAGQGVRMQGTVETTRSSLLDSKGCLGPCNSPIVAVFTAQPNPALWGQTVTFTNNSTGATDFSWSENGLEFSQDQSPSLVFSTLGTHPILLTATNSDPNCIEKTAIQVEVNCPIQASFSPNLMEAPAGSTLVFTNTSNGGIILNYEWRINGQVVSAAPNMSFLFQTPGTYSVDLEAIGPICSDDTTVWVLISGPCGQIPEAVQLAFTATQKLFVTRDILAVSDGSVIHCGSHYQRPMVTRFDGLGNVLWNKELNNQGIFYQIEALPDGNFLLLGEADLKMMVTKMDGNGHFLWSKTLENTGSDYYPNQELNRMLAVNPDGSFGLYYNDNYDNKHYLVKISAAGDILWTKKFNQIGSHAALRRATDGSGDFLLMSAGFFMTTSFTVTVFRISQSNGAMLNGYAYQFPNEDLQFLSNLDLAVHPDGGFSAFWVDSAIQPGTPLHKYLARFSASGAVLWVKKYRLSSASLLSASSFRPLPNNKGWFMVDSRTDPNNVELGNFLQRIDPNGNIVWERKWSDPSNFEPVDLVPTWQSNRVRGISMETNQFGMKLINFPDSNMPLSCQPIQQSNTIFDDVQAFQFTLAGNISPATLHLQNLPLVLVDIVLSKSEICNAVLPCFEICDNQIDDDGDSLVDCLDDECYCLPLDTTECFADAGVPEISMKLGWKSADGLKMFDTAVPLVANLDPQTDSLPEILIAGWSDVPSEANIYIYKGDGTDKDAPKRLKVPGVLNWQGPSQFIVADLDRDGSPEVIALCMDQKIRIFSHFDPNVDPPMQLWATSTQITKYTKGALAVADFDSDSVPEIFIGAQIFKLSLNPPNAASLQLVLSGTAGNGYSSSGNSLVSSTASDLLSVAECFGDPDCNGLELVAGTSIYSVDLTTSDGDGLQIKEKFNLNSVDPSSAVYQDGFSAVADMNLDGMPDLVLNSARGSGNNYTNGVAVWNRQGLQRFYPTNNIKGFYGSGGQMLIANVFDDRKAGFAKDLPEIIVVGQYKLFCFNENKATLTPNSPWWWTLNIEEQSGRTCASAFDFNGDGLLEIVYRGERNLQILYGDAPPFPFGVDISRKWATYPVNSATGDEYPVVADVDHDNQAEIIVAGYSLQPGVSNNGRVWVLESDARPWMPARSIWNQYNYFNVNINDDLTVPVTQQKHWLEMPGIGSGKRPFNTHLVQGPSKDSIIETRLKVPDANLMFETVVCQTDSFEINVKICNLGSASLPAGTPIAFYLGNPTSTAAPLLFPPILMPDALGNGDCQDLKWSIPATYSAEIFAVINDNGTLPRPFNLATSFPSTDQAECHYENNMASFSVQNQAPTLELGPDITLCKNSVVELSAIPNFQRYRWQDGSDSPNFTAFTPGKYWVDAYDACGFLQSDTVNIVLNTIAVLDLPEEQTFCQGETIQLTASGFSSYTWSPADSLSCSDCVEVDVLATKSITVYLTAAEGACFVTDSVRIHINPKPQVNLSVQNGDCDTQASIAAILDSLDYDFLWSNGSTDSLIYPAQAGGYAVTISNASACTTVDSASVQIIESNLSIRFETSSIPCGGGTGTIHATGLGGSGQYGFEWSTGAHTETIEVALPGQYSLTLSDLSGTGCEVTDTVAITTSGNIQLDTVSNMVSCFGGQDGIAHAFPIDGLPPFAWAWQDGQTDSLLNGLSAGTYAVTITDAIGCSGVIEAFVSEPHLLLAMAQAADSMLCPDEITSIASLVDGGTPPYFFMWNNGQTDSLLLAMPAGSYTLTVTDVQDCSTTASVLIESEPAMGILLDSIDPASGPSNADGSIFVQISGGAGPFSFLWSNGATTQNLQAVIPGIYTLSVTDAGGCTQVFSTELGFVLATGQLSATAWDAFLIPNPAQQGAAGHLVIESSTAQVLDFQMFDAIGRLLWKEKLELTGDRFQHVIKAPKVSGVYFVVLTDGRAQKCLRWVVVD